MEDRDKSDETFEVEAYTDLEGLRQLKARTRTGISVRSDVGMFAKPVKCKLVANLTKSDGEIMHDSLVSALQRFSAIDPNSLRIEELREYARDVRASALNLLKAIKPASRI